MFEKTPPPTLAQPEDKLALQDFSIKDLLSLRETINSLLPIKTLKDLDIPTEVIIQFQIARTLQTEVLNGNEDSNKKAQVLNACASALAALAKMQSETYTAERLKNIETHLIKSLQKVPDEYLIEFFKLYENDLI